MDDPEGNLVIVERVGHESQRHFPYWEHSWAGTAHVLNSTRYGNPASHVQRFPDWEYGWDGTAHILASPRYGRPYSP